MFQEGTLGRPNVADAAIGDLLRCRPMQCLSFRCEPKTVFSAMAIAVINLVFAVGAFAQTPNGEKQVREAVQSFYAAFNKHGFDNAEKFTTEDWNHINPFGG
jgi:hypothetical protein